MGYERPLTGAQLVAKRRAALRGQGLKPCTFWRPDTTTEAFKEQARRDCAALWARVESDTDAMDFVEAMTDELSVDFDSCHGRE